MKLMQIVFFTPNKHLLDSIESLPAKKHQLWYGQSWSERNSDEKGILFIDYDDKDFELQTFEKLIEKQYPALRFFSKILISAELTSKEMKKIQSDYRFIDGLIRAPIKGEDIENFLDDYNLVQDTVLVETSQRHTSEKNELEGESSMGNETNKKSSNESQSNKLDFELDDGIGDLEFESASSDRVPLADKASPKEAPKVEDQDDSFFELDSLFEAELENANDSALDQKVITQKTIVYDRSKITSSDVGSFSLDKVNQANDLTKSSSDVLISRPDIEFTVKDILVPKSLSDGQEDSSEKTQEINLADLVEESNKLDNNQVEEGGAFELESNAFSLEQFEAPHPKREEEESENKDELALFDVPFEESKEKQKEVNHKNSPQELNSSFEEIPERAHRSHQTGMNTEDSARIQGILRQLREEREELLGQIKLFKAQNRELEQDNLTLKAALDESKIEVSILRKRHLTDMEDMNYRLSLSEEKKALAEERARAGEAKKEKLEQRVRIDFNQVKQREKELESKLEMLSVDVDSQVQSRDQKILELRRKIDALEFNMENISLKAKKTQEDKRKLEDKLTKIMKTLRHSIKNLEDDIDQGPDERQDEAMTDIRRLKA